MRLIDADALIDEAMDRYCKDCDKRKGIKNGKWRIIYEIGEVPCRACDVDDMIDDLENAPTIDGVERKHGEWVDNGLDSIGFMGIEYRLQKCSNCGETIAKAPMQRLPNFCSNCGADMRGEANKDD